MHQNWPRVASALGALSLAAAIISSGQTFNTLVTFSGPNGAEPYLTSLVQGTDGNLYGTTAGGGANTYGTIFKMTPQGQLTVLYSFCSQPNCADGYGPYAPLVQGSDGNFYGTTYHGGINSCYEGCGTVFKITPAGALTTLHSFCLQANCTDGHGASGLVQGSNGELYGETSAGGASGACSDGCGTIFKISSTGTLTTLHSFDSNDGAGPIGGLIQGRNGNFFGVTNYGATGFGSIFQITPAGTLSTLANFTAQSGNDPYAGLVQATNGNFYGTAVGGGAYGGGTVFEVTPSGTLNALYSFEVPNGFPYGGLVQGDDGNFYGTTLNGGTYGQGAIFEITPAGTLTTLHSFCSQTGCDDGHSPYGGLVQDTSGSFYGTTSAGGADNYGTIFSLSVGLVQFVELKPTSGKVGTAVILLGTNLGGATRVTFNGTAATFTVVSSSEIKTTVPSGATSGKVRVTTASGTLNSNVNFQVLP